MTLETIGQLMMDQIGRLAPAGTDGQREIARSVYEEIHRPFPPSEAKKVLRRAESRLKKIKSQGDKNVKAAAEAAGQIERWVDSADSPADRRGLKKFANLPSGKDVDRQFWEGELRDDAIRRFGLTAINEALASMDRAPWGGDG